MENNNFPALLGPNGHIRRHELTRQIIQSLHSLGYNGVANQLKLESKIPYPSSPFVTLQSHILAGNWEQTINILTLNEFVTIKDEKIRAMVLFLILKQWIIEHLCHGDDFSALAVLRRDYLALGVRKEKIHHLACIIINKENAGIEERDVVWFDEMREILVITELENLLPPPIIVPERRLESLVEMALDGQRNSCIYHNSPDAISLYEDHCCGKENFPTQTVQILRNHELEVFCLEFSNNGKYLASGSDDLTAIIWTVPEHGNVTMKHTLTEHDSPIFSLSWSPDDTMLLASEEKVLILWDVETGTCKHRFSAAENGIILLSYAWFPDSNRFVFGSSGTNKYIGRYNINENKLTRWRRNNKPKIKFLAITPNGKNFICIFKDRRIVIWNIDNFVKRVIKEVSFIMSFSLSRDGQYLVVSLEKKAMLHVWDINRWGEVQLLPSEYQCHHNKAAFLYHVCFGGWDSRFIAATMNSLVYIWNRQNRRPIEVLSGHERQVTWVCWNPTRPQMLATASNDWTIRIWGPPKSINQQ